MNWLDGVTSRFGVALPSQFEVAKDYYWMFDYWWYWLLVLFIPIEVIVRKWPHLVSSKGALYERK